MIAIMSDGIADRLLALGGRERAVAAGETLFCAGDPVRSIYLVMDGIVQLVRHQPHGLQLTLQRASAGDILAEASLFADRYHCDAVAIEDTRLRATPRSDVERAFAGDGAFARAWAAHLAHQVQRVRTTLEIMTLKTVAERLDAWIALNDGRLPPKGEWRIVASEIGVSPEALYRELAKRRP